MITLKTGVPGSGKTLFMVAELLANSKLEEPRPVYTNIEGLALPHILMRNWEPTTKRESGVLYTVDWRQCPVQSLIVVDEAFLYGYDAKSAQATVPDYIRDLAVHRKDFSVDIWFIAQHPKLLHVALRRQVGKHQHYRRLFGSSRAICYEWDVAQDNLSATKTAVTTHHAYPKDVFKAYKSAEVHNKPKFKLPWWVWLPVAIIPAAVWAFPAAYSTLAGAMTGKGLPASAQPVVSKKPENLNAPNIPSSLPITSQMPLSSRATSVPVNSGIQAPPVEIAGCIVAYHRCGCFDGAGKVVVVDSGVCEDRTGQSRGVPLTFPDSESVHPQGRVSDADVLDFMQDQRRQLASAH